MFSTPKAGNTRLEMTADLREKVQHILKSTSMKQQENPADFSSVHKVQAFFAQICCHFTPCISRFTPLHYSLLSKVIALHSGQIKWYSHVACYPKLVLRDVFLCIWGPQNTSHKNRRALSL